MKPYRRQVQYYETDQMGVVHHANYLHWMEEARIDYMAQMGFPYAEMEKRGVLSPVKAIACEYKKPCAFGDTVSVEVRAEAFNGVVLVLAYSIRLADGGEAAAARSEHVFLNREGRFVRLRREMPDFFRALEAEIRGGKEEAREND